MDLLESSFLVADHISRSERSCTGAEADEKLLTVSLGFTENWDQTPFGGNPAHGHAVHIDEAKSDMDQCIDPKTRLNFVRHKQSGSIDVFKIVVAKTDNFSTIANSNQKIASFSVE